MDNRRPTWAEINLTAIQDNVSSIKKLLLPETLLMAVVKANAYGHGMVQAAKTALAAGADYLGVATLDEAVTLRQNDIQAPILVLGYVPVEFFGEALQKNIELTIFNLESAQALSEIASKKEQTAVLHLKVDSGMGRIGFQTSEDSLDTIETISNLPSLNIKGIFTHFAVADERDKSYTEQQFREFTDFISGLENKGIHIPIKHCANSAAIIDLPYTHLDMVRAGIICYGLYPSEEVIKERLPLKPALKLKTRISNIKTLPTGKTISYGRTYTCRQERVIATVPIGYADGYSRLLSNRAYAVIKGKKTPQVGTICMDQCMFDVSDIEDVKVGDEVILLGQGQPGISAEDIGSWMGTINYEVVCMIGPRIPRFYIK